MQVDPEAKAHATPPAAPPKAGANQPAAAGVEQAPAAEAE